MRIIKNKFLRKLSIDLNGRQVLLWVIEKVDSSGKIGIPEEIKNELAIKEGTSLRIYLYDGRIIIERLSPEDEDDETVPEIPTIEEFQGKVQEVTEEIQIHLRSIEKLIESIPFL